VLTNLHASRSRLAAAINCAPDAMLPAYLRAMERPLPPRVVKTGPVKEVVLTGADVDLYALPQIVHHQGDAGPYVTAAISFAKDPESETWNCAYNRLMIQGRDTTSIHLTLGKHLWEFNQIAERRGEPLQLALVIGVHPAIALGALAIGSIDEDERGIMGALLGEPLELVKCETSDVLVPAHAEMVLEAEILTDKRTPEGPFGEFTGYSLGERQREVVRIKAITHRRDAMFQDITVAHLDHMLLSTIPMEANLYRAVRAMVPSVRAVRVPAPFTCYVSIEQRLPGQAKNAIMAVLGADLYMKRVVVVDHDVNVFDDRQVTWAIATRCQPDRDLTIVTHARGSDLDPSSREDGYTAKWGVDATAKPSLGAYTPRHRIPPEVWERLRLEDFLP
jgi:2,5-furandicarboxylate decarboxylase 1